MIKPKGNKRELKKARTRIAIMHAAKGLFEESGVKAVTIEDIAEKADICRSTFFTHFDTKESLLTALFSQELDDLLEQNKEEIHDKERFFKLLENLVIDTYNYPSLSMQLLGNGFLNTENNESNNYINDSVEKIYNLVDETGTDLTKKDIFMTLLGAYVGSIMTKIVEKKSFDDPNETIEFLKKIYNRLYKETGV